MKKTILAVLLAMLALMALCSACGESENAESASVSEAFEVSTPEPAEETPEPTEEPAEETPAPEESEEQRIAIDLIGSSVESLYSAIGSPNSSSYTESCLVLDGEDGFLYYDGFVVATIRRADGSELVYDVY